MPVVGPPPRQLKKQRRKRSRQKTSRGPRKGVVAEAQRALGFSKVRDYSVSPLFSAYCGVPGSLLRKSARSMNEWDRARCLVARLSYLVEKEKSTKKGTIYSRPLFQDLYPVGGVLYTAETTYIGWQRRNFPALKRYLRTVLEEFVNLPLSAYRAARSPAGPPCVSCSHDSCRKSAWSREGRSPRKSSRPTDLKVGRRQYMPRSTIKGGTRVRALRISP